VRLAHQSLKEARPLFLDAISQGIESPATMEEYDCMLNEFTSDEWWNNVEQEDDYDHWNMWPANKNDEMFGKAYSKGLKVSMAPMKCAPIVSSWKRPSWKRIFFVKTNSLYAVGVVK
jgi:hypothetical protein